MRKKHPKGKEYHTYTNLELLMMAVIQNPNYSNKDLEFFKSKITSDYIDHSDLYRLSVKYDQNELTEIILHSGKFDINDGELYLDITSSIMFGGKDRIYKHIKNGYVPTIKELKGIIETYEEEGVENTNKQLYDYFNGLLKNKSTKNEL